MATNPFAKAHWQKIELNKKTAKKIKRAYSTTAKDVKDRLARLKAAGPGNMSYATYSAKKLYLEGLLKDLNNSLDNLERTVQVTLLGAAEESGFIAIKATENMLKEIGLDMKGAFSYVPRQEVANILSGKLYGSDWNFSKAIWGMEKKTKDDLEKIVARGLAENKPIYDIAKDLEKYVDPSAWKPWDWSKVYPGTTKTVDYNAQRLARTMIQHSYQTSMVQAQKDNPFCKGIIWHSVGLHGRTCEQCLERDGQVFPVKDLPLDHPNGLCYFEPALDDMNDIADRLADWTLGKDDPAIDNYVTSAFGMNPGTPLAKQKVDEVKAQTGSRTRKAREKFSPQKWIEGVKKNTQEKMLEQEKRGLLGKLTPAQYKGIERYSGSSYRQMNGFLRRLGRGEATWGDGSISESLEKSIKDAIAGLKTTAVEETIYLRRGSDIGDLAGLLGGNFIEQKDALDMILYKGYESGDIDAAVTLLKQKCQGLVGSFDGFTSTSSIWSRGFDGEVEYIFKAPPGTGGSSIMNISRFGTGEGEFLLNAGTRVRVVDIQSAPDGHKGADIRVFLEIIV